MEVESIMKKIIKNVPITEKYKIVLGKPDPDCPDCQGTGDYHGAGLHCHCRASNFEKQEITEKDTIDIIVES